MSTFPASDDEPESEWMAQMRDAAEELAERSAGTLVEDLGAMGIYVDNRAVGMHECDDGPRVSLLLHGIVGRAAFSDRVQIPEQIRTDDAFADMTEAMIDEEFEQRRRTLLQELTRIEQGPDA